MAGEETVSQGQYQRDVTKAIADTEAEILASAMGEEEPENDGDKSLEEMEDTFEGDEEPEEVEAAGEEGEGEETGSGEQEQYAGEEQEQQPQEDDQRNRWVPPSRLREESDRRRSAENQLSTLEARFNDLVQRLNTSPPPQSQFQPPQPPQPQPEPPMPDRFADPDGFDRWQETRWERKLDARIREVNDGWQREMQNRETARINRSLDATARGPRGWEFGQAYQALTSLPINPQNAATVRAISEAPDPGEALMGWWDENGGNDFRQHILDQLADQYGFIPPSQQQQNGRPNGQPRHVTRLPQGMRPGHRSLNDARGGRRQETVDPEMLDDSDNSVFSFATRR